ncbi:hypothetical protein ACKLNR_004671 [Fusarium oxysporum f. sp. zingiberi]
MHTEAPFDALQQLINFSSGTKLVSPKEMPYPISIHADVQFPHSDNNLIPGTSAVQIGGCQVREWDLMEGPRLVAVQLVH